MAQVETGSPQGDGVRWRSLPSLAARGAVPVQSAGGNARFRPAPALPHPDSAQARRRLAQAVGGLRDHAPEMSASIRLWRGQRWTLRGVAMIAAVLLVGDAEWVATGLLALLTIAFLMLTGLRLAALAEVAVADDCAPPGGIASDDELPPYTVLVPLYREAAVLPGLVAALEAIDYPAERLEVLIIVEQVDEETRRTIGRLRLAPHFRVLVVPDGLPRTKPRALQYALGLARGELLVVYDAEDEPEPDQLRRVVATFAGARGDTACVQARLNVDNWDETWLTRQFAVEYTALFDAILPAIARLGLPVPLGGTSNHFRGIA